MFNTVQTRISSLFPGFALSILIGMAASYLSQNMGGPVMLYALLLGMAFNYLASDNRFTPGVAYSSRHILRMGVVFLGGGITWLQVSELGLTTIIIVISGVLVTLLMGALVGKFFGLKSDHAILSASAVGICGASAALAVSAVLPQHEKSERNTIVTVVGVTTLSTIAMVFYPSIVSSLSLGGQDGGVFLGGTIHDIAQVIGAGYMISDETGSAATIVKLLRVACLLPVVFIIGLCFRKQTAAIEGKKRPPLFPAFMLGFLILMLLNSFGALPDLLTSILGDLSRWCLITAVAALGVKTSIQELAKVGPRPLIVLSLQTVLLAGFILGAMMLTS